MFAYLKSLAHLPRAVHFYLLSEMLFGVGAGMTVILNFHYLALGFDTRIIGISTAVYSVTVALCSYPAGMLTDRAGAKKTMLLGASVVTLGYLAISAASTPFWLYASQVLLGAGVACVISCEFPYIMSLCERKEDETTAFNLLNTAFTMMMGLGYILGTKMPQVLPTGNTKYQTTIYLVAIAYFLMFLMRCFLPASSKRVAAEKSKRPATSGKRRIVPSRGVMIYVAFATVSGFLWNLLGSFEGNVILRQRFGMSDDAVGYLTATNSFLVFVMSLFVPYLMQSKRRKLFLYAGYGLQLVVILLMGFAVPVQAFAVLLVGKGMMITVTNSFVDSSMMKATAEEERGLHSGVRNLTRSGAGAVASYLTGRMLAGGDTHSVYFAAFLTTCAIVLFFFFSVRHQLNRDLDEQF